MADEKTNKVGEVIERRRASEDWLRENFWDSWTEVFRAYHCEREPALDEDGKEDETQTSLSMPDTWSHVRRTVARITAQIPNLRYRAKDPELSELIGRTLMYQWDKAGIQRIQKKHTAQAVLFGWSVRPWYWASEVFTRTKRVNPLDPQNASLIGMPPGMEQDPAAAQGYIANLLAEKGRGNLVPVKYSYNAYTGPKCDFLFVGDCFPEPNFTTLQKSNWFIVERRRNKEWMQAVATSYKEFAAGFNELIVRYPNGTDPSSFSRAGQTGQNLRQMLNDSIDRSDRTQSHESSTKEWTITEMHVPGTNPTLTYIGEDSIWIGEIPYPYDLDGRIAFGELVLIDDLLSGIGDSTARIIRGLQQLHDRQVCTRVDLIDRILRPLLGTTSRELYENPDQIKRHKGFRLVHMRGPGDLWTQPEMSAIAAAAAGMQDESGIMRLLQMAMGDSNLSQNANVDPAQQRTATGARIQAFNQDVLVKDLVDMFNESGVREDGNLMYLLNRSEMSDNLEFDASQYNRSYAGQDPLKSKWVTVEPQMFQGDGEITAEIGSTLADDDESRVTKAMNLFQAFRGDPRINQDKLAREVLVAFGKGKEVQEWLVPPPEGPPPVEQKPPNLSVSIKWELLTTEQQQEFAKQAGIQLSPPLGASQPAIDAPGMASAPAAGGPPPPGPPAPNGPPPMPGPSPESPAMGAYAASRGKAPEMAGMEQAR